MRGGNYLIIPKYKVQSDITLYNVKMGHLGAITSSPRDILHHFYMVQGTNDDKP